MRSQADRNFDSHSNRPYSTRLSRGVMWAVVLALISGVVLARSAAAQTGARAEILKEGKDEYTEHCAACHGVDGRGGGELGQKLFKPPGDLTTIARNNDGQFPFWRAFEVIAGEKTVEGHDTMHMPEFISRLRRDDFKRGFHQAHLRVLQLTHYLESIQEE